LCCTLVLSTAPTISNLSITAVPPDTPALSTVTFSSVSVVNATLVAAVTSTTLGGTATPPTYGENTEEIEVFLSNAPLGSEIYLEEREDGSFYLKVEKTFTAENEEIKKVKKDEPIYGETILI